MQLMYEIPESFWSLFRSKNRETYIEALLVINEEYQYNNYFLSREVCIQVLHDFYAKKRILLVREENEDEIEALEPIATRILNWLVKSGWLRRQEDYQSLTVHIVIPDYASVFIQAFERLTQEELEETQIYIQNIYGTLFSFRNNPKANINMLKTALINTKRLNKALQDMLHNMDRFFSRILEKHNYGDLLKEHLDGYVDEIVKKKYHILKTTDNFYIYKSDIKQCLYEMRENTGWIEEEQLLEAWELIDSIERGFDDIEHRIANMDKEHSKYVRATVTRLNYLLNREEDRKGLLIQLMQSIGASKEPEERLKKTAMCCNLSNLEIISDKSLYKKRQARELFEDKLEEQILLEELSEEEILKMNRVQNRYTTKEIESFIESYIEEKDLKITDKDSFEKLILAYDYSIRKDSKYEAVDTGEHISDGRFSYPNLIFYPKKRGEKNL